MVPDPKHKFVLFSLVILAVLFSGCSTFEHKAASTGPLYKNKADMNITVDGRKFDGMAVTSLIGPKTIQLNSRARIDVLIASSCQRYEKFENVDKGWFGKSGKQMTYTYNPTQIEQEKNCPIYFQAFDKSGITDWGYLAFRSAHKPLTGFAECNGVSWQFAGHSVCQTKAGLEQSIRFEKPVKYFSADPECKLVRHDEKSFRYRPSQGFCTAEFSDGVLFHTLTALGFDQVFVRGD